MFHFILTLLVLTLPIRAVELTSQDVGLAAPKDYSYSRATTRVNDLVSFFENLKDSNSYDTKFREKQNVIITLSEAATKLRFLTDGFQLEAKCNKYLKLISKPNIRTYPLVNLLAHEDQLFSDIEQEDANLIEKLSDNRRFDALSKIQSLVQTLESEKRQNNSNFEPLVQEDLLNCVEYFVYRHQKATSGIGWFVREQKKTVAPLLESMAHSDEQVTLRKLSSLIEEVKKEEGGEFLTNQDDIGEPKRARQWLESFAKLEKIAVENNFELPKLVVDFVTNPKRLKKLKTIGALLSKIDDLQEQFADFELKHQSGGKSSLDSEEYASNLLEFADIVNSYKDLLSQEPFDFIHDPTRWAIIEKLLVNQEVVGTNAKKASDSSNAEEDSTTISSAIVLNNPNVDEDDETTCLSLSSQFLDNLRILNLNNLDINQATKLGRSILQYHEQCVLVRHDSVAQQSNWPYVSLIRKLHLWCSKEVEKINLIARILEESVNFLLKDNDY